jgi:CO/xanthine dehydrogenase Mo-binding subunit
MAFKTTTALSDLPVSLPRFVGRAVNRVEDPLLLTGRAEFIDNVVLPGMLHCAILRSPYAHARIKQIDASAGTQLPGVAAVVTGEDARRWTQVLGSIPPGWTGYCLAVDKVRFIG